ncbi:MAG: hypothetical protein ACLT1T_05395 [Oscillospiraceae bacterium]
MNDMTLFLDLILLASGVYCMYTWLRLAVTKHLFKNGLLVPKEKKISDCADEAEYIRYMTPPLAVMAILTLIYGVIMLLNDQLSEPFLPYPWSLVPLVVVLASSSGTPSATAAPTGLFRDVTPHLAPLPGSCQP